MPLGTMNVTDAAPKKAMTFANGLFMTFVNVGTALSPTVTFLIAKLFGNDDGQFIFLVCAVGLGLATVFALARIILNRKSLKVA